MSARSETHAPRPYEAADPDFRERVRASFARQRIMALIGAELALVEPGACEIRLPFRAELCQQNGYFHGGVVGTIADSAAGYAGYSLMPPSSSVLTVEYKMNLVAPADGELLLARGSVIKPGRTLVVSRADVFVEKSGAERLCATMLQTLITLLDRAGGDA